MAGLRAAQQAGAIEFGAPGSGVERGKAFERAVVDKLRAESK